MPASLSCPATLSPRSADAPRPSHTRRCAHAGTAAAAALLVAVVALAATGHRPLIERSGSMAPAIGAGDLLLVRAVPAAHVAPGDIVTFAAPDGSGRLLTHRVLEARPRGGRIAFVTRGDANTGVERWTIPRSGTVGRFAARVPHAGRLLGRVRGPLLVVLAWSLVAALVRSAVRPARGRAR